MLGTSFKNLSEILFQFLIGKIQTRGGGSAGTDRVVFQFLIGKIQTSN